MERIRLMIVDDYEPIRIGLRSTFDLEEDIEVVGAYGDGESAVRDAKRTMPNVVLMDVRMPGMPGMDGVEACRLIRDRVPGVNVVMLTSFDDEQAATASIIAGRPRLPTQERRPWRTAPCGASGRERGDAA